MKGVVLAGGTGSRLHPLTQITNKHLLPIYDRPMISYGIEALVKAGVSEIMLVTGGTHAGEFLRLLGDGDEFGIARLFYAYQSKPGGIAEALALAERFASGGRTVVLLADNIFGRSLGPCVAALNGSRRIERIVEKPEDPPSEFAVTGAYFYDETVWEVLPSLKPSGRGELEITDVNNWFVERGLMEYTLLEGFWGDAGESIDAYYKVNDHVRINGANHEP